MPILNRSVSVDGDDQNSRAELQIVPTSDTDQITRALADRNPTQPRSQDIQATVVVSITAELHHRGAKSLVDHQVRIKSVRIAERKGRKAIGWSQETEPDILLHRSQQGTCATSLIVWIDGSGRGRGIELGLS